jgi:prepilin-type processing-associated H-X9-DG protein
MKAIERAFWGLAVLGCFGFAFWLWMPRIGGPPEKATRIQCSGNLKEIGLALRMYSAENDEHFPPDLWTLVEQEYLPNRGKLFYCPSTDSPEQFPRRFRSREEFVCDYWYCPGFTEDTAGTETGIVMDKLGNHNRHGNICFGDGHTKGFVGDEWYLNSRLDQVPPVNKRLKDRTN